MAENIETAAVSEAYRSKFFGAVSLATAIHDPITAWDNFLEALFLAVVPAFDLDAEAGQGDRPSTRPEDS